MGAAGIVDATISSLADAMGAVVIARRTVALFKVAASSMPGHT